ncbi:MAG: DUF3107 domain-containing protein [Acidimicrobiales bacterium]
MDVRIGITQALKELEVEVPEDTGRDKLIAELTGLLDKGDGVLWLTDRRGRQVGVPVHKIAYVEVGTNTEERRVGFGGA